MSVKLMVMVRRRQDLSPDQFREGYENGHARLAVRLFGHLWTEYRRNYLGAAHNFAHGIGWADTENTRSADPGYDAISEIIFPDMAAIEEMNRIAAEHQAEIQEDEHRRFDRSHCWLVACETIEHDLTAAHALHKRNEG